MLYQRWQNLFLKLCTLQSQRWKKTDLRRWNLLENLISKWENPSLVELHRLARTEMERLNHAKNANSQWIWESRKPPLIRIKKYTKLLFKKQRYILSGKPKEDGNEVSDCNKKVIYQFHHFLRKKKENGSEF